MRHRILLWCVVVAVGLGGIAWISATAQESGGDPADEWASLSIAEFVAEAERLLAAAQSDQQRAALEKTLGQHAAGRLRGLDPNDTLDRHTFLDLYKLGRLELTEQEQETISLRAVPPRSESSGWTLGRYYQEFGKIMAPRVPRSTRQAFTDQWFADHPIQEYADRIREEIFPIFRAKRQREPAITAQEIVFSTSRYCREKLKETDVRSTWGVEDRLKCYRWAAWRMPNEPRELLALQVRPRAEETAGWDFPRVRAMHALMCAGGMPEKVRDEVVHTWCDGRTAEDFDRQAAELHAAAREDRDAMLLLRAYQSYAVKWLEALVAGESRPWEDRLTYYRWGNRGIPKGQEAAVIAAVGPSAAEMADWTSEGSGQAAGPAALASVAERLSMLADAGRPARQSLAGHVTAKYLTEPAATRSVTAAQWHSFARCLAKDLSDAARTQWVTGLRAAFAEPAAAILVFNAGDLSKLAAALSLLGDEQAYRLMATWTEGTDAWQSLEPDALAALAKDLSKAHDSGTAARLLLAGHVRQKYLADAETTRSLTAGLWISLIRSLGPDLSAEVRTQWVSGLGEAFVGIEQPLTGPRFAEVTKLNLAFRQIAALEDWRQFLDAKLAPADTDAEAKANWLIARALAESIVANKSEAQLLRGRPWLEQLLDTGQPAGLRIHAIEQLTLGYSNAHKYDEGAKFLDSRAAQYPDAETIAAIESLRPRLVEAEVKYLKKEIALARIFAKKMDDLAARAQEEKDRKFFLKWRDYDREREKQLAVRLEQLQQ